MAQELSFQILKLFIMLSFGFFVVKAGLMKPEEAKPLSSLCLYLLGPLVIINAFHVEVTEDVIRGLSLCLIFAAVIFALYIFIAFLLKFSGFTPVERGSLIYTNCGNIIIPIVSSLLGPEYVIYASAFIVIYNILFWTHCISLFEGKVSFKKENIRKILLNPSIIAILFSIFLIITDIQLPRVLNEAISLTQQMIGPMGMIITGMILGAMPIGKMFKNKRIFLIIFIRMILLPFLAVLCLKLFKFEAFLNNGHLIMLVPLLGAAAPSGSMVNMLAILYDEDAEYSSVINVLTTLFSIISMPLIVSFYG